MILPQLSRRLTWPRLPNPRTTSSGARATLRGRALEQKMSSVEYDLLTGDEKIDRVQVDKKPEPPTEN